MKKIHKQIIQEFIEGATIGYLTHMYYDEFNNECDSWEGIQEAIEDLIRQAMKKETKQ
jgi:hypothetical protein